MEKHVQQYVDDFMAQIVAKNPGEKEFHQAVHEVVESLAEYILQNPVLQKRRCSSVSPSPSGSSCSVFRGSTIRVK